MKKKFNTALSLFNKKFPHKEVICIKSYGNFFEISDSLDDTYSVNISTNKVSISYPDPEY
jgi:hypothetical protein